MERLRSSICKKLSVGLPHGYGFSNVFDCGVTFDLRFNAKRCALLHVLDGCHQGISAPTYN